MRLLLGCRNLLRDARQGIDNAKRKRVARASIGDVRELTVTCQRGKRAALTEGRR
jgi:hypothetical protein